jgi:hypothetical protein
MNSWAAGANAWGLEKDDKFTNPNHWDGTLEVVGVTGVVHLGQIQSGLRSAVRLVQVSKLKEKIHLLQSCRVSVCDLRQHSLIYLTDQLPVINYIINVSGEPYQNSHEL